MPTQHRPLRNIDEGKKPPFSSMMKLTSAAFADGSRVPTRHTADGADVSPPLTWHRGPDGTATFALLCEDPDAPSGVFVHWLVWNLAPDQLQLAEGFPEAAQKDGPVQGENDFGRLGWGGPSPPRGKPHRYIFRLYALDTKLGLRAGARRADFDRAISGHVLDETMLIGTYGR